MMEFMAKLVEGELTPDEDAYYTKLVEAAKVKCDSYVAMLVYMKSQIEAAKTVKKAVDAKVAKWENAHERLRERLTTFMENQGIKELRPANPALPVVYLQNGRTTMNIEADRLTNDDFFTERTVRDVNRDKIKAIVDGLIEAGKLDELPAGVTLTTGAKFILVR